MTCVIDRPQLENRMMSLGFSYYPTPEPSATSQPAYSSNSLPRRDARNRHHLHEARAPSADLAHARRKLVSSAVQDYLKSLNAMTRSIVLEKETLEEDHAQNWSSMNVTKREEIEDEHFVPSGVRERYNAGAARQRYPRTAPQTAARLLRAPRGDASGRMHLSQPADWEEYEANNDLVMRNGAASWSNEDSLSQPSSYSYGPQHYQHSQQELPPQPEYRLHKRQLSLRSNHVVRPVVRPHPLPHPNQISQPHLMQSLVAQASPRRDTLGSDGESPRTSDEDSSVNGGYTNPLGFNRSRLRSYSMRQKRGSMRNGYQQHVRSSTRLPHRVHRPEPLPPSRCPSLPRRVPDVAYDDEVDLPDESLLLDHIQGQSDSSSISSATKPNRYSKSRQSQRGNPQIVVDQAALDDDTVFANSYTSTSEAVPESATSFNTDTSEASQAIFSSADETDILPSRLVQSPSHDSLDIDSVSIAPSNLSELDYSRAMTPDSMLSGSTCSYRPNSKNAELAIMRNPRGKRGGSSYKSTTSEFADRHAQFKPNMLRKQRYNSCQNSPALSSTPVPPEDGLSQTSLLTKPHQALLSPSRHRTIARTETNDLPCSPDLSLVSSPPPTPQHVTGLIQDYRRESGYSSTGSSYESFPVRR